MKTHTDTRSEDLIDLGAVATETRGNGSPGQLDDPQIPFQYVKTGLAAD